MKPSGYLSFDGASRRDILLILLFDLVVIRLVGRLVAARGRFFPMVDKEEAPKEGFNLVMALDRKRSNRISPFKRPRSY